MIQYSSAQEIRTWHDVTTDTGNLRYGYRLNQLHAIEVYNYATSSIQATANTLLKSLFSLHVATIHASYYWLLITFCGNVPIA